MNPEYSTLFLLWGILYGIAPDLVGPSGELFHFFILVSLAYLGGVLLFKLTTLPSLIGMLLVGIILQNLGCINVEDRIVRFTSELRRIALVIILLRAGLSLDQATVKKLFGPIVKLGLIPWIVECVAFAVLGYFFLDLPWDWAFLLSCIIASVSPAVVVPCLIRFQNKGYGVDKGIPTLILAAASIDDTISIAVYGIISNIMFTKSSLLTTTLGVPITIIGGVAFGIIWGYLLAYVPSKHDKFVMPIRIVLLFLGAYFSVFASNFIGYAGAGPLAVISAAFTSNYNWNKEESNFDKKPVIDAFRISWIVFEPILFGLTGSLVKLATLDPHIVGIGAACLFSSVIIRIVATIIISFGGNFNMKEKIFIGLTWMAKATVQAALGPLALEFFNRTNGTKEELQYAKTVIMICILSIILTAPLGAVLIAITGPRFLNKSIESKVDLNELDDMLESKP